MKRKPKVPLYEYFEKELAFVRYNIFNFLIALVICVIVFVMFVFRQVTKDILIYLVHYIDEIAIVVLVLIILLTLYYIFTSISKSRRLILTDDELKELKIHSFEDYLKFVDEELGDYNLHITDTLYNFMQSMLDKKLIIMNLLEITERRMYFNKFAVYECNTFVQDSEILLICRDAELSIVKEEAYLTDVENFEAHDNYFTCKIDDKHCVCHLLNEVGNFKISRGRG